MKVTKFIVVTVSGIFVNVENCASDDYNKNTKELLCDIYDAALRVLDSKSGNEEQYINNIKDAIYGTANQNLRFSEYGVVNKGRHCSPLNTRDALCNKNKGGKRFSWKTGCFSESILGTLVCLCTPGNKSNSYGKLCGVDLKEYYGKTWVGGFGDSIIDDALLKGVWKNVVHKCSEESGRNRDDAGQVRNLEISVSKLKDNVERGKKSVNTYFLGGGIDVNDCKGMNGNDLCAAYQTKDGKADIPWLKLIEDALPKLIEAEKSRKTIAHTQKLDRQSERGNTAAAHRVPEQNAEPAVQQEPITHETNEHTRGEKEETETTRGLTTSESAPTRRSVSTPNSLLTGIPHLATGPEEDSTFLTRHKWTFLAALLI